MFEGLRDAPASTGSAGGVLLRDSSLEEFVLIPFGSDPLGRSDKVAAFCIGVLKSASASCDAPFVKPLEVDDAFSCFP